MSSTNTSPDRLRAFGGYRAGVKQFVRSLVHKTGYDIVRHEPYAVTGVTEGKIASWLQEGKEVSFFVVDEGDAIQREHLQCRFYEPEELSIIGRHFRGGCFLDVGANVGNHAIYVALFLGAGGVIAVEPNPSAYRTLRVNIALNGLSDRIRHEAVGLGEAQSRADLVTPELRNLGATQLRASEAGAVDVVPGDDVVGDEKIGFIKIDAEGMELSVLKGLNRTLGRDRPNLFIEVENSSAAMTAEFLESAGYRISERFRRHSTNENILALPTTG